MKRQYLNVILFYLLPLALSLSVIGCALFNASPMPKMSEAKTPAEQVVIAYSELQTVTDTVNNIRASGVVISKADRNAIADKIDKLRMVVDLYALSRVPELTPVHRLALQSQFTKNVRLYNMALDIYNGYENTADGQLRMLVMVNTLTIELIQQLEKRQ